MHPKSIGWLTPKPEPFLVSHIGGKVESALLETTECPFLGPYVRQCLIVLLDIIALWSLRPESWELAERERAVAGLHSNIFNSPRGRCPSHADQSARLEGQTHISEPCWTNLSEDRLVSGLPGFSGCNSIGLCLTGLASQAGLACACANDRA